MKIIINEEQLKNIVENFKKSNLDAIDDFYDEYYSNSKNDTEFVGWNSKKDQIERFKILLKIGVKNGNTILDFGCGLGALYEYMTKKYNDFKYIGVDINNDFIKKCKKKYPKAIFKTIKDISDVKNKYDWFIASGAFTVYTPFQNMMDTIKIAVDSAKYGVAVNFLESDYAKNSDLVSIRGYNKEKLYKSFSKELGQKYKINLIDDYIDNDFTIHIIK